MKSYLASRSKESVLRMVRTAAGPIAVAVVLLLGQTVAAVDWISSVDGVYSNGSNWQGGNPPGSSDVANFTNAGYKVSWDADATVSGASFSAPSGTVTLDIDSKKWTVSDQVVVGSNAGSYATVALTNGTLAASKTKVGNNATVGGGFWRSAARRPSIRTRPISRSARAIRDE